jgi:uncharacterized protein with von Willebrand factor type A (vWA) domain
VLAALADDLLADGDLARALARLARRGLAGPDGLSGLDHLLEEARRLAGLAMGEGTDADGRDVEVALGDRRAALTALVAELAAARAAGDPGQVDGAAVAAWLGDTAAGALGHLQRLALTLAEGGYLQAVGERQTLTPRAVRLIGQQALRDLFAHLEYHPTGPHDRRRHGHGGEPTGVSAPYVFGAPLLLDLEATLRQALARQGDGPPLRLAAADFQVHQTEQRVEAATVILLDVSRSMLLRGCFAAAKKVALALHHLIEARFPRDYLAIITFAHGARQLPPNCLPLLQIDEREYGTNLHQGLRLARTLLRRQAGANKQVIVITDGEPTAHQETDHVFFAFPPTPKTVAATLGEVVRCTQERIVINTFMLERGQHLTSFVSRMSQLNQGRTFFVAPERLGEYVLIDYLANRRALRLP